MKGVIAVFDPNKDAFREIQRAGGNKTITGYYTPTNITEFLSYVKENDPNVIFIPEDLKVVVGGQTLDGHWLLRRLATIAATKEYPMTVFIRANNVGTREGIREEYEKDVAGLTNPMILGFWEYTSM